MMSRSREMTLSALFMALGVLIPFLFHAVGLGPMFLPMFWPLAVAGFFLEAPFPILVGVLTPVLSTMVTGMPPPPILYKMMAELAILTGFVGLLFRRTRLGLFWILCIGVTLSRGIALLGAAVLAPILGLPPGLYALATLVEGMPGVAAMLILLPPVLKRIMHHPIFRRRTDVAGP